MNEEIAKDSISLFTSDPAMMLNPSDCTRVTFFPEASRTDRGFTKNEIWKMQAETTEIASTKGMSNVKGELTCFDRPIRSSAMGTGV